LRGCGAPFRPRGAGGAPFVGAQHAVMVGIQLVEALFGGAARSLDRSLDLLVFRYIATSGHGAWCRRRRCGRRRGRG
jgi:hypothetical protein